MKAIHLRTEYMDRPLGLDLLEPRLYWHCAGGTCQTAYRIVAAQEGRPVWDTGKVASAQMTHIPYGGPDLTSRARITWRVCLWDEADVPGSWAESWFEMGLLHPQDWTAGWITGGYTPKKNRRYPVDCFKKDFALTKAVRSARLYATACGIYGAALNGSRVGGFVLAPGSTDYRKRLQYQVYDVTALLGAQNSLTLALADGWYRGSLGAYGQTNVYGRETAILCQLEIFYTDGSRETINSGADFAWSNDGPIRFADLQDGEVYDAARRPGYSGRARLARVHPALVCGNNLPVTEHEHFSPTLLTTPSGQRVLDFGQNLAGFISFTVKGKAGQTIRLRMGETMEDSGEFTQKNFQLQKPVKAWGALTSLLLVLGQGDKVPGEKQATPLQEITFTCSGGTDHYKTAFALFGFRYALLETELEIPPENFQAIAVYTDLEQTGSFHCSNPLINRFVENTRWSMKSNFADVPTDCPTRERLGWTGDAQVFFDTAAYLMGTAPFYRKYMQDMEDGRLKNKTLPAVVPYSGMSMLYDNTGMSVGWADAQVLIPYRCWKMYGDENILRRFYGMMRDYAQYLIAHAGPRDKKAAQTNPYSKYLYEKGMHLGEWLEPEEWKDAKPGGGTPHPEECTAYLCYTMTCLQEIAQAIGKTQDAALYAEYAAGARREYQWMFLQNGAPDTDRQAKLVRPLALGLAEDGEAKTALEHRLAQAVEHSGCHVGTGFLSTPFLLQTLTEAGRADLAYRLMENEDCPGWLYEVRQGATTVWESWEGPHAKDAGVGSLNHYSPGSACQWLFDTVAGIRVDGENHFTIAPVPGGTLTEASARYDSLYGTVQSGWKRLGGRTEFVIELPPNTQAEVILPGGEKHALQSGRHHYSKEMP